MDGEKLNLIYNALSCIRLNATTEYILHDLIAKIFERYNIPYEREVKIGSGERIDFLIDTIGIEVKIQGSVLDVVRQLQRYSNSKLIDNLILITTKASHDHNIPRQIQKMAVKVISLWKNRL